MMPIEVDELKVDGKEINVDTQGSVSVNYKGFVYMLKEYPFYEGEEVLVVSENYDIVKRLFLKCVEESKDGYGYKIERYQLDKSYVECGENAEQVDWIEVDYDYKITDVMEFYR